MSSTWAPPSPGTSLAGDPEEKNRAGWIGEDFPGCAPGAWPSPRARSPISPSEGRGASAEGGRPSSRGRRNSRGRHLPPSKGGFGRATEARQTLAPPPCRGAPIPAPLPVPSMAYFPASNCPPWPSFPRRRDWQLLRARSSSCCYHILKNRS